MAAASAKRHCSKGAKRESRKGSGDLERKETLKDEGELRNSPLYAGFGTGESMGAERVPNDKEDEQPNMIPAIFMISAMFIINADTKKPWT